MKILILALVCREVVSSDVPAPAPQEHRRTQAPGNGIAKTTYSAYNPWPGLAFMLKYLPTTVAEDSGSGNVEHGSTIQGRCQLVEPEWLTSGKNCELFSSVSGTMSAAAGVATMIEPDTAGSDCTYSVGFAYAANNVDAMYKVFAHNGDTCCKACAATDGCVAAAYTYSSGSPDQPEAGEGFGLHLVDVTTSSTDGGMTVYDLEANFARRLGDLTAFDDFMEYSATLFTCNLAVYAAAFEADGIDTFKGQWTADTGATWNSLFFLVPNSHMILELVGVASDTDSDAYSRYVFEQPRVSPRNVELMSTYKVDDNNLLYSTSVNRLVSNITTIEWFYTEVLDTELVDSYTSETLERRCYGWPGALSDVCFTQFSTEDDDSFTVKDFETMMWEVHATNDPGPTYDDKYNDNHYAVDLQISGDYLSTYFTANDPYPLSTDSTWAYMCEQHYIVDPTGWSIQTDLSFRTNYPGCTHSMNNESGINETSNGLIAYSY